jgi:Secretion system C-terminal sorting domain/Periplasmic copper-binding protein (NosD)
MEHVNDANFPNDDARRAVVCQVFEDLAQFITPANPNTPVNIWVRDIGLTGAPANALGGASSFYIYPAGAGAQGILDGAVWQTIQSGHDAYTNVVSPLVSQNQQIGSVFYHGMMAFNFTNFNWQTDLTTPIANIPGGANGNYDLYSVVLHEITHALGFASLIFQDGTSKLSSAGTGDAYFSRYDKFLRKGNTTILILTDGASCGDMYNFAYNSGAGLPASSIIAPNPTNLNCATAPSDMSSGSSCANAIWYRGSIRQPVYTPYCYQEGSSLSHFEDMCHVTITGAADPKNDNESNTINIDHNRIHAYNHGINLFQCGPSANISLDHNAIEAGKWLPFLWQQGNGIKVTEYSASYPLTINNNTITVNNARYGLDINGKVTGDIFCNDIFTTAPQMGSGVQLQAAHKLDFHNNDIKGLNATVADSVLYEYTIGLSASLSQSNKYFDNEWEYNRYGMRFRAACNNSTLKGNTFNRHKVGLQLTASAIIGHQGDAGQLERYGNRWVGPFALRGAQHEADLGGLGNGTTQLFVEQSQINYTTLGLGYSPFNQTTHEPWYLFKATPGNTYISTAVSCSTFAEQDKNGDIAETDKAIAEGDLDPQEYPEETRWMLRRDLYERLAANDTLLQDSLMAVFYNAYDNTNFADFYYTQQGMRSLGEMSETDQAQVDAVNAEIEQLMQQINDAQIQLGDSTINSQDSLALIQQIVGWKEEIELQRASISSVLGEYANQSSEDAENLRESNSLTEVNEQYEVNEKVVNDIYLATIARQIYSLSSTQQSDLLSIAYQCPLEGGLAVYHARGLYAIVTDSIVWNDDSLCTAKGLTFRQLQYTEITTPKFSSDISLYPNTAANEVTLFCASGMSMDFNISITDVLGKVVKYIDIPNSESSTYTMDISELISGVYIFKVNTKERETKTTKLIIAK